MGRGSQSGLRFGLLGPPVLYDGRGGAGVRVVGSRKQRILLAALLLEAGRVVSTKSLKEALWGSTPPASAKASLHNHVSRLRRLLDDPERLQAVAPGYLLRVAPGELDVQVFESHATRARRAHAEGDWPETVRACAAALALWRGAPLSGVPSELAGYALVQRLEEARLLLLEWHYDAELALAATRPDALVPELSALAAEHPLRESYHRQLMLALHRTGRQAEALAVHRDLRTRLIEELGVEPGPAVREAHVEVLRGGDGGGHADTATDPTSPAGRSRADTTGVTGTAVAGSLPASATRGDGPPAVPPSSPALPAPSPAADQPPPAPENPLPLPRPAQLPPPPRHFTGRVVTREGLRRALTPDGGPAVGVVSGMAGVGKSALALHVAHELRERFPDGQLYVNLQGATPGMTPLTPAQALTALLRDLGADPRSIPEHPDAAAALLRSLLAPTRTLMVLDDAASAAQVRPLLPAGGGCAVIVTSRSPLTALDDAHRFPLSPLSAEESAQLLRAVSGRDAREAPGATGDAPDVGSTPAGTGAPTVGTPDDAAPIDATHPLIELTGRLPLALRVVAARLAARHALTPDVLADQLAATEDRLRHLEYDDLSVRRSLAVAHDALAASGRRSDRDAALTLCRIGALDLPTYGVPLVARLLGTDGTDESRAEDALDRLVDVALLEEKAYGRYAPHGLVRDFARELACAGHAPDIARTALRWYAAVAERALTAIVEPGLDLEDRRRPTAAQPPEHAAHVLAIPPFPSSEKAFAWGESELENIVALAEQHTDTPDERTAAHVSTLLRLLSPFLQRSGRVAETEVLGRAALTVARRLGDEEAEACALGDLAGLHFLTGRHSRALALNDRALAIWRRLGRDSWTRRCLNNRGLLLEGLGRYAESGQALRQSLAYARQLNDPFGEAVTHSNLGNLYEHTDPRAAIEQHRRSLAIGEETGSVVVRHSAHCNIGYAHLTLGEPAAATAHFEESLRILGSPGDWHGESQSRLGLVRALRLIGHAERAAAECAELLRRADARADRYTGALARHQHGLLLRERGRTEEAYEQWRAALDALDGTDEKAVLQELIALLDDSGLR
ncbi:DNA-binding SARP family transcriptional activator/tetratricopeptide (TPR) repeat protein [Streptomyces sp. SAI-133]|uniref:AfsR/SARP family transcriptional regulator n=1 Tax=unclassified Streptomyces TaxID=2593676 RepID=UPI0024750B1D|nr:MULTISPECIES: BTAD domain-containing putative transcriptional regulator [unclassified Streptomyces]MDH6549680.1 DNA-binding SARP family transcriptional activator/tetratricopeptide (TPR) repeat protein [Streptomyces sp. SAI-041]MDH6586314.1 DNA-binding SARP family transcriptional activator/tetratricopeptide (TPR) repeat protein [Streptomyces sp. SAI-133]